MIESIRRRLLVKYPLFGSVVANSNFIPEPGVETAGTDGKNIYYNPNFIESLNKDEQTFTFAHEICHIAFNHIYRSEGKNPKLWNTATDAVINAFLKNDGLPLVEGVVDIEEAINYDAEAMYEKLLKEQQNQNNENNNNSNNNSEKQKQNGQSSSNSTGESSDNQNEQNNSEKSNSNINKEIDENMDVGHDTHSMWKEAIGKKHEEEQAKYNSEENKNNEEIKKLTELGEKEAFKQNRKEKKKQLEKLRNALASNSHGYCDDTSGDIRKITDIGMSSPLIDWRRVLKETIKYDIDWSYQNATVEDGVVNAHLEEIPKLETEIVLDTSGSIEEPLLRNFLRECKNIIQTSKVKVGCFDTKFYGFTEIKDVNDIDNLSFYGGGGTNFDVAVGAFSKRVENKIIFTDGDAIMPKNKVNAIWIVFGNKKIKPNGGKVIYIDDERLETLYNNGSKGKTY